MKLTCNSKHNSYITNGKEYEVIKMTYNHIEVCNNIETWNKYTKCHPFSICVINDNNINDWYCASNFISRKEKLERILGL